MREQIISLLASGASRDDVLKITGCSEELFGEFLKDPDFISTLKEKRDAARQELIEGAYAKLEQATLKRIDSQLEFADIPSLCRVLETTAKNRVLHRNPSGHFTNPTTHLSIELKLPAAAQTEKIVIDQKTNQIIAIGDRNMAAMPLTGVSRLFKDLDKQANVRDTIDADIADHIEVPSDNPRAVQQYEGTEDEVSPTRRAA